MNPIRFLAACWLVFPALVFAQAASLPNVSIRAAEIIQLWPDTAPDESAPVGPEHVIPNRPRPFDQITNVSVPTLSYFPAPPDKRNGTAILVIPGGGLERLALEHEGYEVAEWLNAHGIAAFILKHRVPIRSPDERWKAGLQDAQRAMGLIRARAREWELDADAIGSIGFSAGAEINIRLSLHHAEPRHYPVVDSADSFSSRPDFNIAIYGGGFADTRTNTLRGNLESLINASTPPMFIAHAFDDQAMNSVILMSALKRAGIASELHIFGAGAHGFGVRDTGLPVGHWRDLCLNWLGWQGWLDAPGVRNFARQHIDASSHAGTPPPRFTVVHRAGTLPEAFAARRRIVRHALKHGAEIAGYKAAFTSAAAQAAVGVGHPLHGVLFKSGRIDATAEPTAIRSNRPLMVETEIGYVMATDIGTKLRVPRQALTTVEFIVPVIELPASSPPPPGGVNPLDAAAANVGSHRYIVGALLDPKSVPDPDAIAVSLQRNGAILHETTGANVREGQARNLMTVINQIIDQGHVIHRGDIIVSGALGAAHPGEKGSYIGNFGPLGSISFIIE